MNVAEDKRIKILVLGDDPRTPSGVGTQIKYFIEHLLETNRFEFVCLGGAVRHSSYEPVRIHEHVLVIPVNGYGDQDMVRSVIRMEKPDILWFMTDPRFYEWLWAIDNEIRALMPMVYYHVWDNFPAPLYNRKFYLSNDLIVSISKVTEQIVKIVAPEVQQIRIPHAVDPGIFRPIEGITKKDVFNIPNDKFLVFWNSRNARRKMSGSLVAWWKTFLSRVGQDKAVLYMHTDPFDENGQNLIQIQRDYGISDEQFFVGNGVISQQELAICYNAADLTVSISDAEGFGLSTLESLSCETPILVNQTGGLQEQVTDGNSFFGKMIMPASKAVVGSQNTPYIFEDRVNEQDFVNGMVEMYKTWKNKPLKYKEFGEKGRRHVERNYSFTQVKNAWQNLMLQVYETCGSWENRKNYKKWTFEKL